MFTVHTWQITGVIEQCLIEEYICVRKQWESCKQLQHDISQLMVTYDKQRNQFGCWRATIQYLQWSPCLLRDQTYLDYSPAAKLSTNKGNNTLPTPHSEELRWTKKLSSHLTNTSLFEVQTRKNGGFSPAALGLHMTAIWGYCVFWPERAVYDGWQERKSRAVGLSTDMQIAFSWLLYFTWYLSSGLQSTSLFTARKQLIDSTEGKEEGVLMLFLCWVNIYCTQHRSGHCKYTLINCTWGVTVA